MARCLENEKCECVQGWIGDGQVSQKQQNFCFKINIIFLEQNILVSKKRLKPKHKLNNKPKLHQKTQIAPDVNFGHNLRLKLCLKLVLGLVFSYALLGPVLTLFLSLALKFAFLNLAILVLSLVLAVTYSGTKFFGTKTINTLTLFYLQNCEDLNECETQNACGQNAECQNTIGSYQCVCNVGFVAASNGCKGQKNKF